MGELDKDNKQESWATDSTTKASDDKQYDYSGRNSSFDGPLIGEKSPGVLRIEATSAHITRVDRVLIFLGIFLIAYAYGLDGLMRFTYQVGIVPKFPAPYF